MARHHPDASIFARTSRIPEATEAFAGELRAIAPSILVNNAGITNHSRSRRSPPRSFFVCTASTWWRRSRCAGRCCPVCERLAGGALSTSARSGCGQPGGAGDVFGEQEWAGRHDRGAGGGGRGRWCARQLRRARIRRDRSHARADPAKRSVRGWPRTYRSDAWRSPKKSVHSSPGSAARRTATSAARLSSSTADSPGSD